MSESAAKSGTTTKSRPATEPPKGMELKLPPFEIPKFEMPDSVAGVTAQWVEQGRGHFEKAAGAAKEINGAFEKSLSAVAKCATDSAAKVTDAMHENAVSALDLVQELASARSVPEMVEISSRTVRKQFDAISAQNQEFWSMVQKFSVEATKPFMAAMPKAFNIVPASD